MPGVRFHLGKARDIDLDAKTVRVVTKGDGAEESRAVRNGTIEITEYDLDFDVLVVAVGARNVTFGIPGVVEHVHFLKELTDARRIRKNITQCLEAASCPTLSDAERARLCHFVVVGGGPTGTEFSAELRDFLNQDAVRFYPEVAHLAKVTLIEGREILGSFSASLRQYATNRFKKLNINIRTGANVKDVSSRAIYLDDGDVIPYGMCVWSTGIGPRRITQLLDPKIFAKDRTGKLVVDDTLRVKRAGGKGAAGGADEVLPGVFALGDCAVVESHPYAALAQVAERQGKYLAAQLNDLAKEGALPHGKPASPFVYTHMGSLAYVGNYAGLTDLKDVDLIPEGGRAQLRGFISWLIWRSAYLSKLGSWRNKLQVPMDWTRTLIFGRDLNSF